MQLADGVEDVGAVLGRGQQDGVDRRVEELVDRVAEPRCRKHVERELRLLEQRRDAVRVTRPTLDDEQSRRGREPCGT